MRKKKENRTNYIERIYVLKNESFMFVSIRFFPLKNITIIVIYLSRFVFGAE